MNSASFHLVIRNDDHCPICRRWYLTTTKDDKPQTGDVTWIDEWVRRRNGDKYQTINIIPDKQYDLSEWKLESNPELNINASHLLLKIRVDKNEYCPDNIKYYVSFYKTSDDAYRGATKYLENTELSKLKTGYWKEYDDEPHIGDFFIIIKLEKDEEICLNDFCPQIQPEHWFH